LQRANPASQPMGTSDLEHIQAIPLFQGVDAVALGGLLARARILELRSGDVLLSPGDSNDRLFLILQGHMLVQSNPEDETTRILGPGDLAGDVSLIANAPVYTRVTADDSCRVLEIPRPLFWRIAHLEPSFSCNLLQVMARRLSGVSTAVTAARVAREEYQQRAQTDPLTGLYNRRWMDERLTLEIARSDLRGRPLCLIMLDIDHFKPYNDTHGHMAGDLVLQTVAREVMASLRDTDMAVRFGGEEITVILPRTDMDEALGVAERLHSALKDATYPLLDGTPLPPVTISIGLAQWTTGETASDLLRRADEALYRAKNAGRDCTSL